MASPRKSFYQLDGIDENDRIGSFSVKVRWGTHGYTHEELYQIALPRLGNSPQPASAYRTGFLAKSAMVTQVPRYVGVSPLVSVETKEIDILDNHFEFVLEYASGSGAPNAANEETTPDPSDPDDPSDPNDNPARPSIRVATQEIIQTVPNGNIRVYKKTGGPTVATPKGIMPDGKGGFRGARVIVPTMTWSEPHVIAAEQFSIDIALELVGRVNAIDFRGRPPKTVLCLGGAADQRPDGRWDASIDFHYQPRLQGKAPGFADFEDVLKEGWEFMFQVTDSEGEVNALAVAPLYDAVNFSAHVPSLG